MNTRSPLLEGSDLCDRPTHFDADTWKPAAPKLRPKYHPTLKTQIPRRTGRIFSRMRAGGPWGRTYLVVGKAVSANRSRWQTRQLRRDHNGSARNPLIAVNEKVCQAAEPLAQCTPICDHWPSNSSTSNGGTTRSSRLLGQPQRPVVVISCAEGSQRGGRWFEERCTLY